jgi:hypothetical protein
MKSETSFVARQYRLQQWAGQIQECQNRVNGTTVKEWCDQHEITPANYYYRLKEVRKTYLNSIPAEAIPQNVVPVPLGLIAAESQVTEASVLEISVNKVDIHVTVNTSPELLKMVIQVALDVK